MRIPSISYRILEYLELKGIHKDHSSLSSTPHSTTQNPTFCPRALSKHSLKSGSPFQGPSTLWCLFLTPSLTLPDTALCHSLSSSAWPLPPGRLPAILYPCSLDTSPPLLSSLDTSWQELVCSSSAIICTAY